MALAEGALAALVAPGREELTVTDLLPQPKRPPKRSVVM